MNETNQTNICKDIEILLDLSPTCFIDIPRPNFTDCDKALSIYRLILVNCYIEKLFYPTAAILVIIGTILNLFSLYCFLKMNKRNSQNVYLSVLSLTDTINLQVNFTIPLLRKIEKIDDIFEHSYILCRAVGFLTEFFLIFPTWIVVLLTLERLICILLPLKCYSLYTHKRAKISIFILALTVICLCLYRFFDLKGIDQVSVFSVTACGDDAPNINWDIMRSFNLIIWAILPECLTLIMSLIIIYNIKLATQQFEPCYSKARQTKYNQATKTVLLISVLFLIFHTPTGIMITIHLIYKNLRKTESIGIPIILVSRKITVIFFEISLSCKFFIYNRTFRNFKNILHTSLSRFTRQSNSAKLGRPVWGGNYIRNQNAKTFQFSQIKRHNICQAKETDGLVCQQRKNSTKTSTSTSRASRAEHHQQQQQPPTMTVVMMKTNVDIQVSIFETPNLLRRFTGDTREEANNRSLWRSKPQMTL
ncbi:unnamed protein product [Adineta steineri]|uniref:G-protein coupled receptors family 1 profile domain-containing protein n=1 Tax=Adineta steineri TaxID=433720 RepID=A0A814XDZ4_9BILA|nr:unnamed protein product [Adineta steineri]CAF4078749.1 unnamed protein product [Adineta steineri]